MTFADVLVRRGLLGIIGVRRAAWVNSSPGAVVDSPAELGVPG